MMKHPDPKIQHYLQLLVIVCALGVIVLLAVEFLLELTPEQKLVIQLVNLVILLVFLIELLYNLYYADKKKDYLKTHWLDVIAVLPVLEVFRLSKIAGLSRLGMISKAGEGVELIELAELSKLEKTTRLERVYEFFRAFWHEKLAFGNRRIVSLPLRPKGGGAAPEY